MTQEEGPPTPGARRFAAIGALIGWAALVAQLYLSMRLGIANGRSLAGALVVFFSYFTVLTNILVALALTARAVGSGGSLAGFFRRPGVNTAIAASIGLVGITYSLVLRQTWQPQGLQLVVDVVLHDVMPVLFLLFWWLFVPKRGLRWTQVALWALYPLGYFLYALVFGAASGFYAYPFIDVEELGYGGVFLNALLVLPGFAVLALLLLLVGRLSSPTRTAARPRSS